ncbi:unnamed protein product [Pleuronectes platessa]|uniref:Uncharacterized protein n=1 Tax=Pleuronectes platessa TaxID=8262 RepID=A0A9N7YHH7_PLEPL|nr:unnamed protein product [Pleuronectes platessa]
MEETSSSLLYFAKAPKRPQLSRSRPRRRVQLVPELQRCWSAAVRGSASGRYGLVAPSSRLDPSPPPRSARPSRPRRRRRCSLGRQIMKPTSTEPSGRYFLTARLRRSGAPVPRWKQSPVARSVWAGRSELSPPLRWCRVRLKPLFIPEHLKGNDAQVQQLKVFPHPPAPNPVHKTPHLTSTRTKPRPQNTTFNILPHQTPSGKHHI